MVVEIDKEKQPGKDGERDERFGELADEIHYYQGLIYSAVPLIHMAVMAIDIARQKEDIYDVDDLLIHPLSHVIGDHEGELLLKYVSEILVKVVEELDPDYKKHYGVAGESKGSLKEIE